MHDPAVWLKTAVEKKLTLPELHIVCGRQDDLYPLSKLFHAACQAAGVKSHYHEEEGRHDWYFWDAQIKRLLASILERPTE